MEIAIVAAYKPDEWTSHTGYIEALRDMNHNIHIFTVVKDFDCLDTLLDKKNEMDLVIVFGHGQINDKRLNYKNFKCPVFGEMGDDPQQFNNNIKCAALYDILLTPDLRTFAKYKAEGWEKTYWWTHCFDPKIFYLIGEVVKNCDVVTGMNDYGQRSKILKVLASQDKFKFVNSTEYKGSEYARHLQTGKILFNCSNWNEITRRLFEGMACGQFVITDHISERTGLYQLFTNGMHFVTYKSDKELLEKIEYYLEHEDERIEIAKAGYQIVQQHSAVYRVKQLIQVYEEVTKF